MDWGRYPNFKESEFACRHCGQTKMDPDFMHRLQVLRDRFKKPMTITSGYRCPQHPIEAAKSAPGPHSTGKAADIAVQGADAHRLLSISLELNFAGIGVQQKGDKRFLHLDTVTEGQRPTIWSY
jgi:zinc D-Ala-D-Ala carboxypeptidase